MVVSLVLSSPLLFLFSPIAFDLRIGDHRAPTTRR
jgi:hypothetical protein